VTKLIKLYTAIVESAGWDVSDKGNVTAFQGPVEIADKQLVMPTKTILRNPDWDNTLAFHPMSENVMRGESAVLFELRKQMQFKLNFVAATIIQELGELAADPARQKPLTIKQKEYLTLVPDFDTKTVKSLDSLLNKINPNEAEKIIGIFVKRAGELNGKKVNRLASIHSPLRAESDNKDRTVFGVKFRKCDYKPFFEMLDFIVPGINEHAYSFGSNSMVAPGFHALLHAYISIAHRLNVVLRKFQKIWGDDFDDLLIDIDWADDVKELDQYKGLIPSLRGNEGSVNPDEVEQVDDTTVQASVAPKKKLDWTDKQAQAREEGRKMTLSEKLAEQAPPVQKPFQQQATTTPAAQPQKKRFQDMVNAGQPAQQQGLAQQPMGGPAWANPQQGGFNQGFNQHPAQRSTPYLTGNQFGGQGFNRQGGW